MSSQSMARSASPRAGFVTIHPAPAAPTSSTTQTARSHDPFVSIGLASPDSMIQLIIGNTHDSLLPSQVGSAQERTRLAQEIVKGTHTTATPVPNAMADGEVAVGLTSTYSEHLAQFTVLYYEILHVTNVYALTIIYRSSERPQALAAAKQILASWRWNDGVPM